MPNYLLRAALCLQIGLLLSACAGPSYLAAETSEFVQANYAAVDKLVASTTEPIDKNLPLRVATVINIGSTNQSSRFGRLLSEQVSSRLVQQGYSVTDSKLRSDAYMREGAGELLNSRGSGDRSKQQNAQVVVGNYAVASGYVYITLKVVTVNDDRVIAAVNYLLPMVDNVNALLY